ncbi:MAG: TIGR00282 family metallophosphoesterase [Patescibacteria group bacterium]
MTILFFGDIVGKIGRKALAAVLPDYQKKYKPDLIIGNVENLAHGKGVTFKTLDELLDMGFDCFTSGNHIWKKKEVYEIMKDDKYPLLRPANYPEGTPGIGVLVLTVGARQILILNLQGRTFMLDEVADPFRTFDKLLAKHQSKKYAAIIVDFHAEATSDKVAFGWYANGRASAVIGTHTHIPTADARVLDQGTAYITDVGMVAARDSVLGVDKHVIIKKFLTQLPAEHTLPETGEVFVNAVVITIDSKTGKASDIKFLPKYTDVN